MPVFFWLGRKQPNKAKGSDAERLGYLKSLTIVGAHPRKDSLMEEEAANIFDESGVKHFVA